MTLERGEYHDYWPEWRNATHLRGSYVGVELEVEASRRRSYQTLLDLIPAATASKIIAEDDCSLSYESGVELVFPPIETAKLLSESTHVSVVMEALNGQINTPSTRSRTGMHLNFNTNGWDKQRRAVFMAIFNNIPRRSLTNIGGRNLTGYCERYYNLWLQDYVWNYGLASDKETRVELRFPRATCNIDRFKALIQFITLAENWASTNYKSYNMEQPTAVIGRHFMRHLNELQTPESTNVLKWMNEGGPRG